jgi:hypothetical protein
VGRGGAGCRGAAVRSRSHVAGRAGGRRRGAGDFGDVGAAVVGCAGHAADLGHRVPGSLPPAPRFTRTGNPTRLRSFPPYLSPCPDQHSRVEVFSPTLHPPDLLHLIFLLQSAILLYSPAFPSSHSVLTPLCSPLAQSIAPPARSLAHAQLISSSIMYRVRLNHDAFLPPPFIMLSFLVYVHSYTNKKIHIFSR